MNSEPRKRKLSGLLESLEKRKQREIKMWQDELNQCREALRKMKNADTKDMTPLQFAHYRNRLHLEVKKGVVLTQKLKAAGVQVEKRGRPKKRTVRGLQADAREVHRDAETGEPRLPEAIEGQWKHRQYICISGRPDRAAPGRARG